MAKKRGLSYNIFNHNTINMCAEMTNNFYYMYPEVVTSKRLYFAFGRSTRVKETFSL